MSKKMKKKFRYEKARIASICAAVVMFVGIVGIIAFDAIGATNLKPYYGIKDTKTKLGEYETEYVLGKKLYNNSDQKFKVLEIAPNVAYGSLGYMMGDEVGNVRLSDIEKLKAYISETQYRELLAMWKQVVWFSVDGSGGGAWNHIDDDGYIPSFEYNVEGEKTKFYDRNYFAKALLGNSYLSNKMDFICKNPADVTVEDIESADLVYVSGSDHIGAEGLYNKICDYVAQYSQNADIAAIADRYPAQVYNVSWNDTNNISEEVAIALVQHNVVDDKAVLFDFAASNANPTPNDNLSKVYEFLCGIDGKYLKTQFMKTPVYSNQGEVIRYEGDLGYIDLTDFTVHFVGPMLNLGYNVPIDLTEDNEWVLRRDYANWVDGKYVTGHAGDKLKDLGFNVENDQVLNWKSDMFVAIGTLTEGTYVAMKYPYYNANALPEGYMNGAIYVFNGTNAITQDLYGNASYNKENYPQYDVDYDKAEEIYGDDGLTNNEIIKYLLGIYPTKVNSISVLEIQPAGFFEYSSVWSKLQNSGKGKNSDTRVVPDLQTAIDLMYMIGADTSILTSKNYENKVKITSLPSNGYNGLITDLATEYDLIIVGTQSEAIDANVRVRYYQTTQDVSIKGFGMQLNRRDDFLDDMVYYPIGDVAAFGVGGLVANNYDKITIPSISLTDSIGYYQYTPGIVRYSGNDFTDKAYNRIVEYVRDLNMPLMVSDQIYNQNRVMVGSTTNVFKLGNLKNDCPNIVKQSEVLLSHSFGLKDAYKNYVANRVTVTVDSPEPLQYQTVSGLVIDGSNTKSDGFSMVKPGTGIVEKDMVIKGSIIGSNPAVYKMQMYVDRNGDGIFRTDLVVDDKNEIFADGYIRVTENGDLSLDGLNQEDFPITVNGRNYELAVTLPDALTGYFKWKIVLTEEVTKAQSAAYGEFIVKAEDVTVKVLQIVPDTFANGRFRKFDNLSGGIRNLKSPSGKSALNVSFTSAVTSTVVKMNNETNVKKYATWFESYFDNVSDITGLTLDVDILTTTGYENLFIYDDAGNVSTETKAYRGIQDYNNYDRNPLLANDYDMVIIGFSDTYSSDALGDKQGAVTLLKDFAAKGNSLLFTHDTIIYQDLSDGVEPMYNYFDHVTYREQQKGTAGYKALNPAYSFGNHYAYYGAGSDLNSTASSADFAKPLDNGLTNYNGKKNYTVANGSMIKVLRSVAGMDVSGVSTAFNVDGTRNPDSLFYDTTSTYANPSIEINGTVYKYKDIGQTQCMGNAILAKYGNGDVNRSDVTEYRFYFDNFFAGSSNYEGTRVDAGLETTTVSKLNNGQVTQYPYLIPDRITVANTHSQWYQLDLEGKSDLSQEVVVWYVLSDTGATDMSSTANQYKVALSDYFESTGLDAVNNYYIYSKGNITYSGAGHDMMSSKPEIRLFVNTVIRAITSGNSVPKAEFTSAVCTDEIKRQYTQYVRDPEKLVVTIKATDDDMKKAIRPTDYSAGQFKYGFVYWDVNDNTIYDEGDVIIKEYFTDPYNTNPDNILYNGIPRSFDLADYTAPRYCRADGKSMVDVLTGNDDIRIGVHAQDSFEATGTATCKVIIRELFDLN